MEKNAIAAPEMISFLKKKISSIVDRSDRIY